MILKFIVLNNKYDSERSTKKLVQDILAKKILERDRSIIWHEFKSLHTRFDLVLNYDVCQMLPLSVTTRRLLFIY